MSTVATAAESPQPGMSGATTWNPASAMTPMFWEKLDQPVAPGPDPCSSTTGG
ncbi:hypothetical protein [Calidifontibacter terrae]